MEVLRAGPASLTPVSLAQKRLSVPQPYTHADFTQLLTDTVPELRAEVEDQDGLLHMEMHVFARFTQAAIDRGDWATLKRCVHLATDLWTRAAPTLRNALNVSFLEHLSFTGSNGEAAWQRLTRELQTGWREMRTYNEALDRKARGGNPLPRRA